MANNPLAADHEGRRENWLLLLQVQWPPPLMAAEAGREADANSRAASPRGCTRLRRKPLAGEPRGSALLGMSATMKPNFTIHTHSIF